MNPADAAARAQNAMLDPLLAARCGVERPLERLQDALAILRMDRVAPIFERDLRLRIEPPDLLLPLRPEGCVGLRVPFPDAEPGRVDGQRQALPLQRGLLGARLLLLRPPLRLAPRDDLVGHL